MALQAASRHAPVREPPP